MSRYNSRNVLFNDQKIYEEFFKDRNIKAKFIQHFESPSMRHPTVEEIADMTLKTHMWTTGDRYFKLANEHYGNPELWWVIAWFNRRPTESHIELGDIIEIPFPLNQVMAIMQSGG